MTHYPDHPRIAQTLLDQQGDINRLEAERDGVYRERAHLVALLAALHPSHIGHTDPDTPDWAVVIVETPAGQMSWHIAPRDMDLFTHVQPTNRVSPGWDGHTTDEKYERVRQLIASTEQPSLSLATASLPPVQPCTDPRHTGAIREQLGCAGPDPATA
ncbi:hypothetical protein ACFW9O_25100 [Streptomyces sp. NPDC059499]|uniref:WDGH domain-containing protein n=1 Tax=Streptomyces sp. NPDC059499 TaxID=3346852 RepID=UPI0036969BE0